MAGTKKQSVGSLKKGSNVVVDDVACTVTDFSVSRPGKHGHAKVNFMAVGMLDGRKRNVVMPGHDSIDVPIIEKRNAQVLSVSSNQANVMDSETFETFDLEIPSELEGQVVEGVTILYWEILNDRIMKQIKSE